MSQMLNIRANIPRKESFDKVTGSAKYTDDTIVPGVLYVKMLTSPYSHAKIISIDTNEALKSSGVKAVITGEYFPTSTGSLIEDRPPLARDKVRYFGEPIALVVASSEQEAMKALRLIQVEFEPLPIVNSVIEAIDPKAPLIHENLAEYTCAVEGMHPEPNSNVAHKVKIRKGDMEKAWADSEVIVEASFSMPQSDHIAMETRNTKAEILPDGRVFIYTSSQSPFTVQEQLSRYYKIPPGDVIVRVPFVGGAFGGKAPVDLEFLAYLASKAVGGRMVKIANAREEDIATSPCKIGIEATLKIGATKDGIIKALKCNYLVDCGAYSGTGPKMAMAIASNCSGPYNIENVWCDSSAVYTNHTYVTSYRGFGHSAYAFCVERMLDKLAAKLNMDPIELRLKNSIKPGDSSPTQSKITLSNTGNISGCLERLKDIINWKEGTKIVTKDGLVRAKGVGCFWKTSSSPTDAISGVLLTFNKDGSINLNCGAVEMGSSAKTTAAQILAKKMQMDIGRIHVFMGVDTEVSPTHWKTVASMTTFMLGNAIIKAADDLIMQLKNLAAQVMKCPPADLEVSEEKVFLRDDPEFYINFKDLVHGYKYESGTSVGGQIMSNGSYIMRHLTTLDSEAGKGKPGASWTVGAQAVEIEYDPKQFTYRLINATTVIDVGKVINPNTAKGLIMGGMSMGLGLATREEFLYDQNGVLTDTSLRTYKVMRYMENPKYSVDFLETPQVDAPFGARGLAEHGIIAIHAAFANAISRAAEAEFDRLPIIPELIWKTKTGGKYDTL